MPSTPILSQTRILKNAKQALSSLLNQKQKNQLQKVVSYTRLAYQDFRTEALGDLFPPKPTALNLLVNDVCNSRCQMCLIWKNKKDRELTPDELARVLDDDLFSNLQYVGVSGGEPTLRSDLSDLFKVICAKTPRILGTGIITNGIIHDVVKQRVLESAQVCASYGVPFNVMFSLDGLEAVHDTVRGRKNNFESTLSLLQFFHQETDIPTSFGCTITSSNALEVDELLDFAKAEGLYGRFRIAEFINRLYNQGQTEFVRAFDDKTLYHLGLFFFRAEQDFEPNPMFRKTYRNIRRMLVEGKPRQIGCPYQARAAVLTSRGELLYCAPKSPSLGNTLETSARKLFFSNLDQRQQIRQNDCKDCIHDYHVPVTFREQVADYLNRRRQRKYDCAKLLTLSATQGKQRTEIEDLSSLGSRQVLIVGWYGTETVGDKAILWTVIERLRSRPHPPEKIYLSSLYPFISDWTIREMNLGNITLVETYSQEFETVCDRVDEVVVGGGPLMDIEPLNHILYAFTKAAQNRAVARIEGCGVGPLHDPVYTQVVSEIFRLSDQVSLRDQASADRSLKQFPAPNVLVTPDPATDYVQTVKAAGKLQGNVPPLGLTPNVACFLREWTQEYAGDLCPEEFDELKQPFETQLADLVGTIATTKNLNIHLLPMHTFHVGGDDRVFNRRFAKALTHRVSEQSAGVHVAYAKGHISPAEILQSMYHAQLNICMRFHSVLFAETLGVPYLAIDYTGGGKIKAFLHHRNQLDRLISLQDVATGKWQERMVNGEW
ncbi:polysaccharide pyruvyl transferase family protein [Kovacikia minuta CCNUW1]|uniref:polysaccharide pyruvyl transferase family protein n=1 Tax=Kovacikia minuta TaxID=2931930 RepID=UPI001CCE5ED5|nr:polysaccharide pyruvyl transferase family protein [Kovacikia minuta]UBF27347.1 polysaccharide pyruvyl transferase family protein [Kovacikia minuta CCNUW1]